MNGLRAGKVLLVLALGVAASLTPSVPGGAQVAPAPSASPAPAGPAPGSYGPPMWLPLRADLDGGPIVVGCTYQSHGSAFGYECGGHHDRWALDFLASAGTPVYAAGRGFATDLTGRPGGGGFGRVVQVDHGNGDVTLYAHLTTVAIPAAGTWVDETTLLGTVGSTGSSSANHLHYERRNLVLKTSVDPGVLLACQGDLLVRYPAAGGTDTWKGLMWGAFTVQSEDTGCATARGEQKPPKGAKSAYGARTAIDHDGPGPWGRLLARPDPLDAALGQLLSPSS